MRRCSHIFASHRVSLLYRERSIHSYPEALVACQSSHISTYNKQGFRVDDFFEARGRPPIPKVFEDLQHREVEITDGVRAVLLSAHALELYGCFSTMEHREIMEEVTEFFQQLLPSQQQSPLLATEYFTIASQEEHLDSVDFLLRLVFLNSQGRFPNAKELLHEALHLCEVVCNDNTYPIYSKSPNPPWKRAVDFIDIAKQSNCIIDPKTVVLLMKAAGESRDEDFINSAAEALSDYPYIGRMLRKSSQFYYALIRAYSKLPEKIAFEGVEEVFDMMAESGMEPSLAHYEGYLLLCSRYQNRERGERVMDDALSVAQSSAEESSRFEAACIRFYSSCQKYKEADYAIKRAQADRKLGSVSALTEAALTHFIRRGIKQPYEDVLYASTAVAEMEAAQKQFSSWSNLRLLFLEAYSALGDVAHFESLVDEYYAATHTSLLYHKQLTKMKSLRIDVYRHAVTLAGSQSELD